ncbi:MAG: ATP-binding cassette domain-containing protein, partial [Planctomycetia bacterium]|nr:ATP-binding cassette domain-containing protein [Planctomycetia bacterium]
MILQARNIVKRYPGVLALDEVDLDVAAGEIVAVVGENGAGKSTLMKILAGDVAPDDGSLLVDGEVTRFGSPREAIDAGVVLIHQELSLADNLDVGANILLGREPRTGPFLRREAATARATVALRAAGLDLEPSRSVADLGMGTRQLVEIAKALSTDARV